MTTTSLSLLARACREDDSQSWSRLAQLYSPLLKTWLRRFDVQDADAEDIVQDVLGLVSQKLPDFRHNRRKGAFRSWLRAILITRLKEFWRLRQKRPVPTGKSSFLSQLEELEDSQSEMSQLWDSEHDEFVLRRLLDCVKPRFESQTWRAFCSQVLEEKSANVVAAELGISLSSVYVAKSRVLRALKQESRGLVE